MGRTVRRHVRSLRRELVRDDAAGRGHVIFIVRDDAGGSDILFQTSDTTASLHSYGGSSLYDGYPPVGRAYKVSYNRPFATRQRARPLQLVFCLRISNGALVGSERLRRQLLYGCGHGPDGYKTFKPQGLSVRWSRQNTGPRTRGKCRSRSCGGVI
jgi:hypothetical protein